MTPENLPARFRNIIQEYKLQTVTQPVVILADPQQPSTMLSFTPGEPDLYRPVIFQNIIEAALYRETLLSLQPDHLVKTFHTFVAPHIPMMEGYIMRTCVSNCPICGNTAAHGDPETQEFYCESCGKPFPRISHKAS